MEKVNLSDIVSMRAFEEAGDLFHRATGMTISFYDENGQVVFYPREARCDLCQLVQGTEKGAKLCLSSDTHASEKALRTGRPISYTCHAGLTDVVVPVVVGGERVGCFYSGQSLLTPPTAMGYSEIRNRTLSLGLDTDALWDAYNKVPVVNRDRLELAMGLLSIICKHLVEGEIALRQERELGREQRKLRRAAEETARLERDLREMELKLMQAQLNPHFLFNALNLILGQSMSEKAERTAQLVEELSVLLRSALAAVGSMVTLRQETESASAYVAIFRARFGRDIDFGVDLPERLRDLQVPSLILQPLVENAIIHALPLASRRFSMDIRGRETGEAVELRVSDNGPGIPPSKRALISKTLASPGHESKLTGLLGLNRRLKYYYPGIRDIELRPGDPGLSVILRLPAKLTPKKQ